MEKYMKTPLSKMQVYNSNNIRTIKESETILNLNTKLY